MFKLRILYFYVFCLFMSSLVLASINSILSKFGGALRYICWFLIIPFLSYIFHKMLRNDDDNDEGIVCQPRGLTISNFSAVFVCVCVICCLLSHVIFSAQKGTIFDKILMCLILSVYFYVLFSFRRLL